MPVYKDKAKKTYYVVYRKKDSVTGKLKQHMKRGFKTKTEAKAYLSEQTLSEDNRTAVTFKQMDDLYIEYKNAKEDTQQHERTRVDKYCSEFKDKPISAIKRADLLKWSIWLNEQPISTTTKNACIYLVRGVFKFASEFYNIPNIATVLKKQKVKQSERKEMNVWTVDEFNQFIQHVENPYYRGCYTFLYWTGCRRGEALALRKEDITDGVAHIWHAIKYFDEGFQDLKNESSIRYIKLDPELLAQIAPLIDRCTDEAPFIFGGDRSLPITNLQRFFNKGIKDSGVKKIRIHDLRHSFATNAINHGANIVAVSKYLGHSTIEQTLQTYTHLLQKTDDEMLRIMAGLHKS